ncbi:MAG: hypothetical protein ABFC34_10435 [Methanobacterium sp.]
MDINEFHKSLAKSSEYPFIVRLILLTASSWIFQGTLYMDTTERNFKIILDLLMFLPLFLILNYYLNFLLSIFLGIILAHTLNWIFNGQIFVLLKNLKLIETSEQSFKEYLDGIKIRVENENSIIAAAAYGSISREKLKKTSDIDVRIIRKTGLMNGVKACIFVLKERAKSFFNKFPLDIYVLDSIEMIHIHIKNEAPVVIYDPNKIWLD